MRDADNIRAVARLGVDMMGFVFCPQSPRYVSMISSRAGIIPDYSQERLESVVEVSNEAMADDATKRQSNAVTPLRVGVFVNDMPQNIVTRVVNYALDYIQLHGDELPIMLDNLRHTLDPDIRPGIRFIKAFNIVQTSDLERCKAYEGHADLFLFDTKSQMGGGSGQKFDWSLLEAYQGHTPFLLSGGIGPNDVEPLLQFRHPQCVGIDVNSCFESEPGVKDVELLHTFIEALKQHN